MANSMYWFNRYIERAENIARFIDVNVAITLGRPLYSDTQWAPLIYASGDEESFLERYESFSQENVLRFLLFDDRNPNSLVGCLDLARENARAIREILSQAMWEAINRFYLRGRAAVAEIDSTLENPHPFLDRVKRMSHQVIGVTEATMSHGDAWNFGRIGRLLERADKTSRILDVKYFILLPRASDVGSSLDVVQWSALLDSTSALHMYRRRYGVIRPRDVAAFLLFDPDFPRSLRYCITKAADCLRNITGPASNDTQPGVALDDLRRCLEDGHIDNVVTAGLHEFVDHFQTRLNVVGDVISTTFFGAAPESPAAGTALAVES